MGAGSGVRDLGDKGYKHVIRRRVGVHGFVAGVVGI